MLRRVAKVLHARVRVVLEPDPAGKADAQRFAATPLDDTRHQLCLERLKCLPGP